jgi:prophage regulatory protein
VPHEIPLMAISEIRRRLGGVSSQRVDAITRKPSFPRPVWTLDVGRVWHRDHVEAWIREYRPDLAEEPEGTTPPAADS